MAWRPPQPSCFQLELKPTRSEKYFEYVSIEYSLSQLVSLLGLSKKKVTCNSYGEKTKSVFVWSSHSIEKTERLAGQLRRKRAPDKTIIKLEIGRLFTFGRRDYEERGGQERCGAARGAKKDERIEREKSWKYISKEEVPISRPTYLYPFYTHLYTFISFTDRSLANLPLHFYIYFIHIYL